MLFASTTGYTVLVQEPRYVISKIEYYDTPYGVPSNGFVAEYYEDPTNLSESEFSTSYRADIGRSNILSYDWSMGSPPGVSKTDFFKARYYGYFYAKFSGVYTFALSKERTDYARFFFNRTRTVTIPSSVSQYLPADLKINDWPVDAGNPTGDFQAEETLYFSASLTEGRWYPFLVEYAERTKEAYLSVRYLEPSNVANTSGERSDNDSSALYHPYPVEYYKVLSAGVANFSPNWSGPSEAGFEPAIIISGVVSANLNKSYNQSAIFDFEVPLIPGVLTTEGKEGYRVDPINGLLYNDQSDSFLRHGRLVKYFAGYSSSGTTPTSYDFYQRFEGVVTDIATDRSLTSSKIKVKCQDVIYHAINSIEENYPDKISYVNFDFTENNVAGEPAGKTRPVCYDAWPVVDTIRDLYIKAGVDPTKLYGRKKYLNVESGYSWGDYYIEDRKINLKRKSRYGNPDTVSSSESSDDKYIWGTEFGKPIFDKIAKIADLYGFVVEVSCDGYPTFQSINSPVQNIVDSSWSEVGSWTTVYDLKSDGGVYYTANAVNAYVTKDLSGSAFVVNMIKNNLNYVNGNEYTSGHSILYNEFPNGVKFDPSQPPSRGFFGVMYGRYTSISELFGRVKAEITYINGTYFFTPSETFVATHISFVRPDDIPSTNPIEDLGISADIYIGPTSDYENLSVSSLVFSNYKRPKGSYGGERKHRIYFQNEVILTGGLTHGIRFITKDEADLSQISDMSNFVGGNLLYKVSCMAYPDTSVNCHNSYKYNTQTVTLTDSTITTGTDNYVDTDYGFSVFPDIAIYGKNLSVGNDINSVSTINIEKYDSATLSFTNITSFDVPNYYMDKYNSSSEYRYPSDGSDFTGINPCKIFIGANTLGINVSGGVKTSYGTYRFKIINKNAVTSEDGTKICSIESYSTDPFNPAWIFDTRSNIKSIGINSSTDDIRNDVIVVGDLLGAFRDYTTNEEVNKNNPTYQYVYGRATDISSINNPNSLNNVGRKKPFIIYEPSITDQRHADWLAQAVLYRFNKAKRIPAWQSIGVPIVETNDNVLVIDQYLGNPVNDFGGFQNQWITDISETISQNNYSMSFTTTPYEPWSSFTQNSNPDIDNFGGQPFINVKMTDSYGTVRGRNNNSLFDVYESESGNRLMLKYDQVIDGDIIVKVMSKTIFGASQERAVAYLVGAVKDGIEVPEYREWGTDYTLYWDCVDQTGASRKNLIRLDDTSDFISSFDQPGYYATSGDYFVRFSIFPRDSVSSAGAYSNKSAITVDTTELIINQNQEIADYLGEVSLSDKDIYEQTYRIKWGDPIPVYMAVSGERSAGLDRNILYYPDNVFYSDEFNDAGPMFQFTSSGTSTISRNIYYKVDLEHYWGLGYAFGLRTDAITYKNYPSDPVLDHHDEDYWRHSVTAKEDWKTAFEYAILGNHGLRYGKHGDELFDSTDGLADYAHWTFPAHFYSAGVTPDIESYVYPNVTENGLEIDHKYKIVESGSKYYVVGWFNTPYTNYKITDYIPQTAHKYSDTNIIEFNVNPESARAGLWEFEAVPDMTDGSYDHIRRTLAAMAYYNGSDNQQDDRYKLKLLTSHMFQVKITIWDSTGRLLKNEIQNAVKIGDPHAHNIYNDSSTLTDSHSHSDYDTTFIMSPSIWGTESNSDSLTSKNVFYETRVSGESNLNGISDNSRLKYGTGFCNITGNINYGTWTWHGYWLSDSVKVLDYRIPFNHMSHPSTSHWIRQSGDRYVVYHWEQELRTRNALNGDTVWYISLANMEPTLYESVEAGVLASEAIHAHPFIYEGINSGSDYDGAIKSAVNSNSLFITGLYNSIISHYLPVVGVRYDLNDIFSSNARYDQLDVDSSFPKCWYFVDSINLPWTDGSIANNYWTNFLIDSGFKFYHGGWSRYLSDQEK